ncbi:BRCT domain-containing protein [Pantoea sp. y20]
MEEAHFVYVTAKNKISAYTLTTPFTDSEEVYLHGFCRSRGHYRTFKCERVIDFFDSFEDAESFVTEILINNPLEFNLSVAKQHTRGKNYSRYCSPGMYQPLDFSGPLQICFTGFKKEDKERLAKLAKDKGMIVRSDVTVNLHLLCGGYNAGPKKLEVAQKKGTMILHEAEFLSLLETGELPDDYDS